MNKRPLCKWLYIYQVVNVTVDMHRNVESDYDWGINGKQRHNEMQMWYSRKVNMKSKCMLFIYLVHVPGSIVNDSSANVIPKWKDLSFVHSFVCFVQT